MGCFGTYGVMQHGPVLTIFRLGTEIYIEEAGFGFVPVSWGESYSLGYL